MGGADPRIPIRDQIIKSLRRDIIGPSWIDGTTEPDINEILTLQDSNPTRRYLGGYLEPSRNREPTKIDTIPETVPVAMEEENLESPNGSNEAEDESYDSTEPDLMLSTSSMGLTFATKEKTIQVKVEWGEYSPGDENTWSRSHHTWSGEIDTSPGEINVEPAPAEGIRLIVKSRGPNSKRIITLRLVNDREAQKNADGGNLPHSHAQATIYQPMITASTKGTFTDVRSRNEIEEDPTMAVLYRKSSILAFGHNVGVDWNDDNSVVRTEHIPGFEVPKMIPDKSLKKYIPTMDELADLETIDKALDTLQGLLDANRKWIEDAERSLSKDMKSGFIDMSSEAMSKAIEDNLTNAKFSLRRMEEGILTLRSNKMAREAFVLSNKAIKISQEGPTGPARVEQFRWFPFQIAFQLLNLNGIISTEEGDPHWKDRDKVLDLAWFPTGGGKTEAYLGLISLTGFFRRMRYPEEEKHPSVHAIMRYTLRLLTMDQSERLVRLVTAMNMVASEHESPEINGAHPFRVGMWVGKAASPNQLKGSRDRRDAKSLIQDLMKGQASRTNTRVIMFESCPWCGDDSITDPHNWSIGQISGREALIGRCNGVDCPYDNDEGIPFTCVDEDIYNNPPSVLLGTADKFVQAARNRSSRNMISGAPANVRTLLGFNGHNRPPDLIIQDELHLLTGPLGSMAGLIETALDVAWDESCGGHRPKYVAATATIRGADRDAKLMFGRDLNIFPPPVDTASDNFFAREAPLSEQPGRIHLSVLGPPNKSRSVADQPLSSILQSAHEIRNETADDNLVDPYWTLVAYYNSLRELGGAQSSLATRVKSEWVPEFSSGKYGERQISNLKELTSRVPQDKLVSTKSALENDLGHESPVDVVVTSNMFQVGIDISRLGIMTINGQPKSNSEYIQSSGRVGRKYPGVVVSLLRSTYPRDQSHYETHRAFHQEIYRHVDRTSTTPFSLRALDRALDTTLMALIRMTCESLSERDSLNQIVEGNRRLVRQPADDALENFRDSIRGRLGEAGTSTGNDQRFIGEVVREIDRAWSRLKRWVDRHHGDGKKCCWTPRFGAPLEGNEISWARGDDEQTGRLVVSSLRDVADEVAVARTFQRDHPGFHKNGKIPVSHILSHASPGSVWEKDGRSYLTLGINNWQNFPEFPNPPMETPYSSNGMWIRERHIEADGSRLLRTRERDPVSRIRALPTNPKIDGHVSYMLWPRIHRCEDGHLSKPLVKEDEDTTCGNEECNKPASQMRFVSICEDGHLHEFDYSWWVHKGSKSPCSAKVGDITLELRKGHAYSLGQWVLRCSKCGSFNDMKRVPLVSEEDRDADNCGRYGEPWLQNIWDDKEACDKKRVHRQVGATSVTYNKSTSILLIPLTTSYSLANSDVVKVFLDEPDLEGMMTIFEFQKGRGRIGSLDSHLHTTPFHDEENEVYDYEGFLKSLSEFKEIQNQGPLSFENVRKREWSGLHFGKGSGLDPQFHATKLMLDESPWGKKEWPVSTISRVDRLTELRLVTGISRVLDSNLEIPIDEPDTGRENYGIGSYNYGEGIFIELNPLWLMDQAKGREEGLGKNNASMPFSLEPGRLPMNIQNQIPSLEETENRNAFTILHTLSHLLIRKLCAESGYSLGSVRERLYFEAEGGKVRHAAILIYTSGPSSDGTLGGLSGQAGIARMKGIIDAALKSRTNCSNDPVCREHYPLEREPNGAACHTCIILPETSCECRNHMLDRNWGV